MHDQYEGERDDARFWAEAKPTQEPATGRAFLIIVALALVASVPWYWSGEAPIWLGLPAWVWVTVGASATLSAVTAWGAFFNWRDE